MNPGEELWVGLETLEFPALQDWNHPFWKDISQAVKTKPQKMTLKLEFQSPESAAKTFETTVLLKDCSAKQRELFEQWTDDPLDAWILTDEDRSEFFRRRLNLGIEAAGMHFSYNTIRGQISKPSIEGLPETLDGWKALEAVLDDGTLKDEVRFVLMFLEYMETVQLSELQREEDFAQIKAVACLHLQPFCEWLRTLPEVQQYAMLRRFGKAAPNPGTFNPSFSYKRQENEAQPENQAEALQAAREFYGLFTPGYPPIWTKKFREIRENALNE